MSIFKVLDDKGRVLIPYEMRKEAEIECGDIVKISMAKGIIKIMKADLIEVCDQSADARKLYVSSAVKQMSKQEQLELAEKLIRLNKEGE
ncbi:MAG: hypothetical protein KHW81_16080 [[Clostridium] innocuum]|nr:hypothetical protein [[Clostridium] innocuum]MBS5685891.1 hypothetical protein [[Clostridium] innocuum]